MSLSMKALALAAGPLLSRRFSSTEAMDAAVSRPRPDPAPSRRLSRTCHLTQGEITGFPAWDALPIDASPRHAVLYLHGGAYTFPISPFHWSLVADISSSTTAHVSVPLYGLAPEHTYRDAYPLVEEAFDGLARRFGPDGVTIMGDSAGGGLAVGLAQVLRDQGVTPRQVIAISPWLDLTLTHPDVAEAAQRDPWLKRPGLIRAGEMWAGGDDPTQPRLSPLQGRKTDLPPTSIYIGDRDLFLPDARAYAGRAGSEDAHVQLSIEPGALHAYPLLPAPEGRRARAQILRQLEC